MAGNRGGGAEDGGSVGGGAKADVPDYKFAGGLCEAFANLELGDVKKLGFGLRAKTRVHFFAIAGGKKGVLSVGKAYELVVTGHRDIVEEKSPG